ncbi:hypothetical protein MRB53_030737 [Persea americana]|uniref:Uncharacterized protein n=1 Tax=Persea americana TaxID=3435 RepID=A0ACC2KM54_PERAE|nr:hypothetical protein MRB53_030737 [Persea americana]
MCYVGKATKIFIIIVSVLVMFSMVLVFRFLHHGHRSAGNCANGCHPVLPVPATTPPPTMTSPPATPSSAAPPHSPPSVDPWQTPGPVHS